MGSTGMSFYLVVVLSLSGCVTSMCEGARWSHFMHKDRGEMALVMSRITIGGVESIFLTGLRGWSFGIGHE